MTISYAVDCARMIRPSALPFETYLYWLNAIEGRIQTEVMLLDQRDVHTYKMDDKDVTLLVKPPYDHLYVDYLISMIDFYNKEVEMYQYSKAAADASYTAFVKWYMDAYLPANDIEEE